MEYKSPLYKSQYLHFQRDTCSNQPPTDKFLNCVTKKWDGAWHFFLTETKSLLYCD